MASSMKPERWPLLLLLRLGVAAALVQAAAGAGGQWQADSWSSRGQPDARGEEGAAVAVRLGSRVTRVTWEGWGIGLSWWANFAGGLPDSDLKVLLDLVFDKRLGLGLNLVRYNIGGGYSPVVDTQFTQCPLCYRGMPGFRPAPGGPFNWSADGNQRKVLLAAKNYGVNLFEAFSNSPPPWMTLTGSVCGNTEMGEENFDPEYDEEFAEYLAEVVREYRDNPTWAIPFHFLAPFNEPMEGWWVQGKDQEGCNFSAESINRLVPKIAAKLLERGLATRVSVADSWIGSTMGLISILSPESVAAIAQFDVHTYLAADQLTGRRYPNGYPQDLARAEGLGSRRDLHVMVNGLGKRLWQSEFGPLAVPGSTELTVALEVAKSALTDINQMRVSAWAYWQVLERPEGTGYWGFFKGQFAYGQQPYEFYITKQYWVMMQLSRWIRPGCHILDVADTYIDSALAAYDPELSRLSLVLINVLETPATLTIDLNAIQALQQFGITRLVAARQYRTSVIENHLELPAVLVLVPGLFQVQLLELSITTFVFDGVSGRTVY